MGKVDQIAARLGQSFSVPPSAARGAVCLVLKAHSGDGPSSARVAAIAGAGGAGAALLCGALKLLQQEPSFWISHYGAKAHASAGAGAAFTTGDFFSDVASVVKDPGKAISKAVTDVTRDPLGSLANVVQAAVNVAVPVDLLSPIPGLGSLAQIAKSYTPASMLGSLAIAGLHGDMKGLLSVAKGELDKLQAVASMVPGLGTGVSTAIGAAEALLNGGKPIEIALRAAYGAIPIPPGIRQVTDVVLDSIIALANGGNITDVALTVARDRIPAGMPRDVFDTLAQIIVRHKPIAAAAVDLAEHEALKLAQGVGPALVQGLAKNVPHGVAALLSKLPDPSKPFPGVPSSLLGVAGLVAKLPAAMQKAAGPQVATMVAQRPKPPPRPVAPPPPKKAIALHLPAKGAAPARTVALRLGPSSSAALLTANAPYDMFAVH
jgi:hypothetical protein